VGVRIFHLIFDKNFKWCRRTCKNGDITNTIFSIFLKFFENVALKSNRHLKDFFVQRKIYNFFVKLSKCQILLIKALKNDWLSQIKLKYTPRPFKYFMIDKKKFLPPLNVNPHTHFGNILPARLWRLYIYRGNIIGSNWKFEMLKFFTIIDFLVLK
jgi:hypothetical protein